MINNSQTRKEDVDYIIKKSIDDMTPKKVMTKTLNSIRVEGTVVLIAIGKAAWEMANETYQHFKNQIKCGLVITKYGHSKGSIGNLRIIESSHPIPDDQSLYAGDELLKLLSEIEVTDQVLLLISGGGSALVEVLPSFMSLEKLQEINEQLIRSGASIEEINAIRKRVSLIKGGKLAQKLRFNQTTVLVLSDVVSNSLDSIASGLTKADELTREDIISIMNKYDLNIDKNIEEQIVSDLPFEEFKNIQHLIIGSVEELCSAACSHASQRGYNPILLNTKEIGNVHERMVQFVSECLAIQKDENVEKPVACIFGGEMTLIVKGNGKGGRNQETALFAAKLLNKTKDITIASVGSDGTDGPTDAAGGIVDESSWDALNGTGDTYLQNNDSYFALEKVGSLIKTGPTGTNVNDIVIALIY